MTMSIRFAAVPLLLVLSTACAGTRHAAQLGVSRYGDDYEPLDRNVTLGWSMNQHKEESGLGYEVGAQFGGASDDIGGVDADLRTFEVYGGPRFEWALDGVNPYVSGGLSALVSDLEGSLGGASVSDDDTTLGLYLGAGVDFDVTDSFFLGLGLRGVFGHEPEAFGFEADGDFVQGFLRLGATF